MPSLTFPISNDLTLRVPATIGADSATMRSQIQGGHPPTAPIRAAATIDTGATVVAVSTQILHRLGVVSHRTLTSTTVTGNIPVDLYWISICVFGPGGAGGPLFLLPDVEATGLPNSLDTEVLIGMNVLVECELHLNGPARLFSLTF